MSENWSHSNADTRLLIEARVFNRIFECLVGNHAGALECIHQESPLRGDDEKGFLMLIMLFF